MIDYSIMDRTVSGTVHHVVSSFVHTEVSRGVRKKGLSQHEAVLSKTNIPFQTWGKREIFSVQLCAQIQNFGYNAMQNIAFLTQKKPPPMKRFLKLGFRVGRWGKIQESWLHRHEHTWHPSSMAAHMVDNYFIFIFHVVFVVWNML